MSVDLDSKITVTEDYVCWSCDVCASPYSKKYVDAVHLEKIIGRLKAMGLTCAHCEKTT